MHYEFPGLPARGDKICNQNPYQFFYVYTRITKYGFNLIQFLH